MDNCGGRSYDGAVNMAGRYAGALTLVQHQFVSRKALTFGEQKALFLGVKQAI